MDTNIHNKKLSNIKRKSFHERTSQSLCFSQLVRNNMISPKIGIANLKYGKMFSDLTYKNCKYTKIDKQTLYSGSIPLKRVYEKPKNKNVQRKQLKRHIVQKKPRLRKMRCFFFKKQDIPEIYRVKPENKILKTLNSSNNKINQKKTKNKTKSTLVDHFVSNTRKRASYRRKTRSLGHQLPSLNKKITIKQNPNFWKNTKDISRTREISRKAVKNKKPHFMKAESRVFKYPTHNRKSKSNPPEIWRKQEDYSAKKARNIERLHQVLCKVSERAPVDWIKHLPGNYIIPGDLKFKKRGSFRKILKVKDLGVYPAKIYDLEHLSSHQTYNRLKVRQIQIYFLNKKKHYTI